MLCNVVVVGKGDASSSIRLRGQFVRVVVLRRCINNTITVPPVPYDVPPMLLLHGVRRRVSAHEYDGGGGRIEELWDYRRRVMLFIGCGASGSGDGTYTGGGSRGWWC